MPGGRLTKEDRRQIAEGLREGLGYAEIARRMARPTSTVSREVSRNGGPNRYRPERAQLATVQRARRRRAPVQAPQPAEADDAAVREFSEQFIKLLVRTGLPRSSGAVLAELYLADGGSRTAAELVQRLQVSAATVSTAVNQLETQGLIRRERQANSRREHYIVDEHAWVRATLTSAQQVYDLAEIARRGAEMLGVDTPAGARAHNTSHFLEFVGRDMIDSVERWRKMLAQQHIRD
ncbi:GbsR/MarR family transcriptional regulator [Nocardia altamirensis]|uniref:GbsR/MarR family transcriptional regulator n=1 Tax=Nocardia altamirensis TaxID=472158 RepID=UPI00083FF1D4|nr:MarR family transcriptional regulator [Nocardia altamirensis]